MGRSVCILLGLMLMVPTIAGADASLDKIHAEIDATVWKPFQHAFERQDGEALNRLYAEEVLRVTPEGVDTSGAFKQTNLVRFDAGKARGDRIRLDFWFDSRRATRDTAYEVGFYRLSQIPVSGEPSHFYGQFHIVLRKQKGRWLIAQDWDTDSIGGRPIAAADFERQAPRRF